MSLYSQSISCGPRGQLWAGGTEEGRARALPQGTVASTSVSEAPSLALSRWAGEQPEGVRRESGGNRPRNFQIN